MSSSKAEQHAREIEAARDREFDAVLEQEFAGAPPVAAILQRARQGASVTTPAGQRSGSRRLLAAALALLGIAVAVVLAWQARAGNDDHNVAAPQDPSAPVDVVWPKQTTHISKSDALRDASPGLTHLDLGMTLHAASDLSRFGGLDQLRVRLPTAKMGMLILSGKEANVRGRLDALATAKNLRRLSLHYQPFADEDLSALRHLERLQVLEIVAPFKPVADDELRAAAASGGAVVGRAFDRSFGAAVAAHSRAKSLLLASMPITSGGLRALADAKLHSLTLAMPADVTPEVLLALGELVTLRHLELRAVHSAKTDGQLGGSFTQRGSRALSAAVMAQLATLPELRSLTLDQCLLDPEVVAALPRQLHRLDLSSCFGVDGRLADAVAVMPKLREVGLPLVMADDRSYSSMWRPPITGTGLHQLRLSGAEAANIIGSRVWHTLRLDGQLSKLVTDAVTNQNELRELVVTPTVDSEPLSFIALLPKLERITFVQVQVADLKLRQLNECVSLRAVSFDACYLAVHDEAPESVLREGIVTRWGSSVVH